MGPQSAWLPGATDRLSGAAHVTCLHLNAEVFDLRSEPDGDRIGRAWDHLLPRAATPATVIRSSSCYPAEHLARCTTTRCRATTRAPRTRSASTWAVDEAAANKAQYEAACREKVLADTAAADAARRPPLSEQATRELVAAQPTAAYSLMATAVPRILSRSPPSIASKLPANGHILSVVSWERTPNHQSTCRSRLLGQGKWIKG